MEIPWSLWATVPGSGHHPSDQICPLCLNPASPFASCVPATCHCGPPRRAQLPVLLAYTAFSTSSPVHGFVPLLTQGSVFTFAELHEIPSSPFLQLSLTIGQLLFLYWDQPAAILQRNINARQETCGQYPIKGQQGRKWAG